MQGTSFCNKTVITFKYPSQFTSKEENVFVFFDKTKGIDLFREMVIFSQYFCNFLATLLYMKMGSIFSPVQAFMWQFIYPWL